MSGEPDNTNPNAGRMNEVFDFESRPGLALVRPEIAKQLAAACKPPADANPVLTYHPDDEEEEDGICGRTWYLEWDMWVFILLCALSLAGVWQVAGWACDLWQWLERGLL
jgi:hypothetical protein